MATTTTRLAPLLLATLLLAGASAAHAGDARHVRWRHLSTKTGDLQPPNAGRQQTSLAVGDFDGDGVNDFVVTERTMAPSVVLYRRTKAAWDRSVVDATPQHIEAGSEAFDIDGDGDQDLLVGGDWASPMVWWYENPSPKADPGTPWPRHVVKDWGATKHHDQAFGDFDGDGRAELAFWNQGGKALYVCDIPAKPATADRWPCAAVYTWSDDSEMFQRQTKPYPGFKAVNEHEGFAVADVDRDGHLDIWVAEMRLDGTNPDAKNQILFGDGRGGFEPVLISEGIDLHESEIVDLDGDSDLDVIGKPYNWNAPRLDVWINEGPGR